MTNILLRSIMPRALLALFVAFAASSSFAGVFRNTSGPSGQENVDAGAVLMPNGKVLIAGGAFADGAGPVASAQLYDPLTETWSATGSLNTARENHTITLLQDGTVLVAGGFDGTNNLNSTEIYDPSTGLWRVGAPMGVARANHEAVALVDGRIFVVSSDSAEIYDPASARWQTAGTPLSGFGTSGAAVVLVTGRVLVTGGTTAQPNAEIYDPGADVWTATAGLVNPHTHGTLTVLENGDTLLAGGDLREAGPNAPSPNPSVEVYDVGTNQWSSTGDLRSIRQNHSASLLPNGQVVVIGGNTGAGTGSLLSSELYDPNTGKWTNDAVSAVARASHTATILPSGRILVVNGTAAAGSSAELYDPANPFFGFAVPSLTARTGQTYTLLSNGQILLAGGEDSSGNPFAQCELYDFHLSTWSGSGSLQANRAGHTATLLANGKVLVVGGFTPNTANFVSSSELYDPATGKWTTTSGAPLNGHIEHTVTLLRDGRVLVAAGFTQSGDGTFTEIYDPGADSWSQGPSIDQSRLGASATLLPNGKVLIAGGSTTQASIVYDPVEGIWESAAPLITARKFQTATLLPNGQVLVAGGQDANGNTLQSAELYHPSVDPGLDQWTPAQDMLAPCFSQTASLLFNGQVLMTGGNSDITAELYDPATGQWSAGASLSGSRRGQTAIVVGAGRVLVAGGSLNSSTTDEVRLYDPGLGDDPDLAPRVLSVSAPLRSGDGLTISGMLLTGLGGASSGNTLDSSTNYSIVRLESLVNAQVALVPATYLSSLNLATAPVFNFPAGYARLTLIANGMPSDSVYIQVVPGAPYVYTDLTENLTSSGVDLFAKVVANSSPTIVYFEYGSNSQLATFTTSSEQVIAPSSDVQVVDIPVHGLAAHSAYYYRAVARNGAGITLGQIQARIINTPNTAPTAANGTATLVAGSAQTLTLPFAATDADGDSVSIATITSSSGQIGNKNGNQVTITYPETFSGPDTVTYTVSDGAGGTAGGAVTVTVTSPAPIATDDAYFTGETKTAALTLDVLTNDISSNPPSLTIVGVGQPEFGSIKIAAGGKSLVYTPRIAFSGVSATDTFTYTIQDATGMTATGTVRVNNPSNLLKGSFDGLVGNGPNTGYLSLVLTANGSFTGKLRIGSVTSNFKGTLGLDGSADVTAGTASMNLALDPSTGVITATIMEGANFYGALLTREDYSASLAPAPQAGQYTAIIPREDQPLTIQATATVTVSGQGAISGIAIVNPGQGYVISPLVTITSPQGSGAIATAAVSGGEVTGITVVKGGSKYPSNGVQVTIDVASDSAPAGAGYATLKVAASGAANIAGKLGDGTAFTTGGFVKSDGSLALFTTLPYKEAGTLLGTIVFQDIPEESDCEGVLTWTKPAQTTSQRYQAGFSTLPTLVGGRYVAPAKGENALNFGRQTMTGVGFGAIDGDLPGELQDQVSISTASVVHETSSPTDKLTVKINPDTGLVTGSFTTTFFAPPTGQKTLTVTLNGAIVQKVGVAGGFFLGPEHSGIFSFPAQ